MTDATGATGATDPIRVLLVDDHDMVAESLRRAIEREADLAVVAVLGGVAGAGAAAEAHRPNVAVVDFRLPDGDGIAATQAILAAVPSCRVLLLTGLPDRQRLHEAIAAGCVGYLEKRVGLDELVGAIRRAHAGELVLAADDLRAVLDGRAEAQSTGLTPREAEVLELLAAGLVTKGIAERLGVSADTARTHVQRILGKLDAHSRLEAVAEARRRGLID